MKKRFSNVDYWLHDIDQEIDISEILSKNSVVTIIWSSERVGKNTKIIWANGRLGRKDKTKTIVCFLFSFDLTTMAQEQKYPQ